MSIDLTSLQITVDTKQLKDVISEFDLFTEACTESAEKATSGLAVNLLAQEEMLRQSYENRRSIMMEAADTAEQGLTAVMMQAAQERIGMLGMLDTQNMQSSLARYQQTYNGISGIAKGFVSEIAGTYGDMFGMSKAFAIADSTIQMLSAVMKAANTPFPANLMAMATVAASTAGLISQIKSTNFAGGFDRGGNIMSGKWGIVGEYGPEIVRGPAGVVGREETVELLREALANRGQETPKSNQTTQNIAITLADSSGGITDQMFKEIRSGQMDTVIVEIAQKMRSMGIV